MFKTAILAGLAQAQYGYGGYGQVGLVPNYGGSVSGNRFVDDWHDAIPDPTSPYGHRHLSGTHSDHGHGMKNGWGVGHSHQYLTPVRDYVLHDHGDGIVGPGGRYGDQAGGRYGLSHRWGQYSGYGHGHNPAGGHGWGDHDDHDVGDGHGFRLTWGRGTHGLGALGGAAHGFGDARPGNFGGQWGGYAGIYSAPARTTRTDNLSSTYRLPSETDYNRVVETDRYTTTSYGDSYGYGGDKDYGY